MRKKRGDNWRKDQAMAKRRGKIHVPKSIDVYDDFDDDILFWNRLQAASRLTNILFAQLLTNLMSPHNRQGLKLFLSLTYPLFLWITLATLQELLEAWPDARP